MKPGLTGYLIATARDIISITQKAEYGRVYTLNYGPFTDTVIHIKDIWSGAYLQGAKLAY